MQHMNIIAPIEAEKQLPTPNRPYGPLKKTTCNIILKSIFEKKNKQNYMSLPGLVALKGTVGSVWGW